MDKKKRKTRHKNRYKSAVEQKHTLHNKDTHRMVNERNLLK